ncbi:MAG: hypothetical protein QGF28_06720 [Candidatus Thalassarchaeaceae archaeon]|nr:hypothetical protein [Candidatus Thalassarchaeaceae archaeon]
MTYSLRLLEEVEDDAYSALVWYEERRTGLGEEFLEAFFASARQIPENPHLHEVVRDDVRRMLLRRFPYAIYYMVEHQTVVVIGLFHCARDPRIVEAEVRARNT